jgi:hypothetical protein
LGIFPCQIQFQVNNKSTIIKLWNVLLIEVTDTSL